MRIPTTKSFALIISSLFLTILTFPSIADQVDDLNLMRDVALQLGTLQNNSSQLSNEQSLSPQELKKLRLQQWNANNPQAVSYSPDPVEMPEKVDLFDAAKSGDVQSIQRILSQGLNVNSMNAENETALHMAAAYGHYSAVIFLVNHGANINARTIKNWIPLHHAVRFQHPNIVNYLVQRGSSAAVRTSDGYSSIDIAKSTQDYRILSLLGSRY